MRYLLSEIYLNATETEDACSAEEDVDAEMKIGFRWCVVDGRF